MATVTRTQTKACCGGSIFVFQTSKPIRKPQAQLFRDAGYFVPDDWFQRGLFWVKKDNLIVTAAYGSSTFQVRCYGDNCTSLMDGFAELIDTAVNS